MRMSMRIKCSGPEEGTESRKLQIRYKKQTREDTTGSTKA